MYAIRSYYGDRTESARRKETGGCHAPYPLPRGNNWLRFNDGKGLRVNRPGSRGSELMDMKDCSMLITAHLFALEEDKFNHIWIGSDEDVFRLTLDANRKIVKIA